MPMQYLPKNWTPLRATPVKKPTASSSMKPRFVEIEKDGEKQKMVVGDFLIIEGEDKQWLRAYVPNDKKNWIGLVRNIPSRKWNAEGKYWLIPFVRKTISYLKRHLGNRVVFNVAIPGNLQEDFPRSESVRKSKPRLPYEPLQAFQKEALNEMENQLRLEGKEHSTIKTYRGHLRRFFRYYSKVKPKDILAEQIKHYLNFQLEERNVADNTYGQILNSLVAFYRRTAKQAVKVDNLPRPKKRRKLPNVMSKEEVQKVIASIQNEKQRMIVSLMYSSGLRVGEVVKVKVGDLNFDKKRLFVKAGKGDKDRYTFLPKKTISLLRSYISTYQVDDWLFEGQNGGHYSVKSVQQIVKTAVGRSRVKRRITPHSFRHAFTTHLHDFGYSVEQIRIWLGHAHLSTTQGYLHIGNDEQGDLKSPFDDMIF